jgi:hypothetical protein
MPDAPSSEDPLPERLQRKGGFQQTLNPAFSMKMRGDGPNRAARFVRDNQMDLARRDDGGGTGISTARDEMRVSGYSIVYPMVTLIECQRKTWAFASG